MAKGGAAADGVFDLPEREPTVLARYSRRSKLAATLLVLIGGIGLSYVSAVYMTSREGAAKGADQHAPRIIGTEAVRDGVRDVLGAPFKSALPRATDASGVLNQQDDMSIKLAPAPDPGLVEPSSQGDLPRIGEDGRQPWQVYARPFNVADTRPRMAIIVSELGRSNAVTETAVVDLPANVTLAFDTQGTAVASWCNRARQVGHEILLSVPMEPFDFPRSDPGPQTLLTSSPNSDMLEKLNWSLRQATGYVGVTSHAGSRFTTDPKKLGLVMDILKRRGLMVVDAHESTHGIVTSLAHEMHVPVSTVGVRIDDGLSPEAIDASFRQLEQAARLNGHAVGVVPPLPIVMNRLRAWLKTLPDQGIALAPVSALVR